MNEDKFEKAKTIMDLAIEKMPIDYFGYYSLLVPFVDGYYRIDNVDKAKDLSEKIAYKYADRLNYFSSLNANEQKLEKFSRSIKLPNLSIRSQEFLNPFKFLLEFTKFSASTTL